MNHEPTPEPTFTGTIMPLLAAAAITTTLAVSVTWLLAALQWIS